MPSKSATDITAAIDEATDGVGSLTALGLWAKMRRWIESSSHAGHLMIGGLPGTLDVVAHELGLPSDRVSRMVGRLSKVRVRMGRNAEAQLIETTAAGVLYSPPLRRLHERRVADATKMRASRSRKGVTLPPKGGNAGVTVGVTPPPDGFPPHPPSLSPPASSSSVAAREVRAETLSDRARAFIVGHPRMLWDRESQARMEQLVELVGWESAVSEVDSAVASHKAFPIGYALSKAKKQGNQRAVAGEVPGRRPAGIRTEDWG